MSKEGVLSSSNILQVWNNQLKEIRAPRKDCKSRLQRILPSERTQRSHLSTADPTPHPLAGRAWWGHTQARPCFKVSTPGRSRVKTQALGRSGSASVACTQQAFRGHLGNIQGRRGKGHLGPSRRQKQDVEDPPRGKTGHEKADQLTSLHTHHQHTYLPVLNQS